MKVLVFAFASLSLLGCKKEGATADTSENLSQFASELATFTASFEGASAPTKAVSLEWNFQPGSKYEYEYLHSIRVKVDGDDDKVDGGGTITMEPQPDGTANAVVALRMSVEMDGKQQMVDFPPIVIEGIKKNGQAKKSQTERDAILQLLLPLPGQAVKQGEKVSRPFVMPVSSDAGDSTTEGKASIWLEKYVQCAGARCALLRSEISMPTRTVIEEPKSTFGIAARGTILFSLEAQAIAEVRMTAVLTMETLMPMDNDKMSMRQDHYIRVKRR